MVHWLHPGSPASQPLADTFEKVLDECIQLLDAGLWMLDKAANLDPVSSIQHLASARSKQ